VTCYRNRLRRARRKIERTIYLNPASRVNSLGVYSAAFKKDMLSPENYTEMVATMTKLNRVGEALARDVNVHAMTDVQGCVTGASNRNWASYSASVALPPDCSDLAATLAYGPADL
jgi:selenide,water dikinase